MRSRGDTYTAYKADGRRRLGFGIPFHLPVYDVCGRSFVEISRNDSGGYSSGCLRFMELPHAAAPAETFSGTVGRTDAGGRGTGDIYATACGKNSLRLGRTYRAWAFGRRLYLCSRNSQ